jgi:hypothetical protein
MLGPAMAASRKTLPTGEDAGAFIVVPNEARREDAQTLCGLLADWAGEPPVMWGASIVGFGRYRYRYESGRAGTAPLIGFSYRDTCQRLIARMSDTVKLACAFRERGTRFFSASRAVASSVVSPILASRGAFATATTAGTAFRRASGTKNNVSIVARLIAEPSVPIATRFRHDIEARGQFGVVAAVPCDPRPMEQVQPRDVLAQQFGHRLNVLQPAEEARTVKKRSRSLDSPRGSSPRLR